MTAPRILVIPGGTAISAVALANASIHKLVELYEERQAVRDGNVVTANGTGQLEFTRECLLALSADTPEAIEASYKFNKEGFCGR